MAKHYFNNFPDITYNGKKSKNIMLRLTIKPEPIQNFNYHMPLTLEEHERPDTIASDMYEDSTYDWILRLLNNQIDPYYQWYLTDSQLTTNMVNKYGSYEDSISTVLHYKHITHTGIIINNFTYEKMAADLDPEVSNFEPVYAFDYYEALNEDNKIISTLMPDQADTFAAQIEAKLNE